MKLFFVALLLLICLAQQSFYSQSATTSNLEVGRAITRDISGAEKHTYQINLEKDQLAKIIVEEDRVSVFISVADAAGHRILDPSHDPGRTRASFVAPASSQYVIEISLGTSAAPGSGKYTLLLEDVHAATDNDRAVLESVDLRRQGLKLYADGKYKEAIEVFNKALAIREKILGPDDPMIAQILNHLGVLFPLVGDDEQGEAALKRAVTIYEKTYGPDDISVSAPLSNLSLIYRNRGDFSGAEAVMVRSVDIRAKKMGTDSLDYALGLNNLGIVY